MTGTAKTPSPDADEMPLSVWLATDRGRKCPQCGRYAKRSELGSLSFFFSDETGRRVGRVSLYGHLPGYGCNRAEATA